MIKNINFGIKISTRNFNLIPEIYINQNIIDFIEIILLPEFTPNDIKLIKNLEIPYVIHVPNSNYGIDFGDIKKNDNNIKYIDKVNQLKKKIKPLCYIVHPESGDINLSLENLKKLRVKPIAIENMPLKSIFEGQLLGYDPSSLRYYFDQIKDLEFCFDINHAIKASFSKRVDYLTFIKEFLEFKNPLIFHISGGNSNNEADEHLYLYEGDYDFAGIKNLLFQYNKIVNLTFETPRNYEKRIEDDLKNMAFFIES